MSRTSKSPRKVAVMAVRVGERVLPRYAHRCAPKKFTQPQLFACLVLKTFFDTDYRGIEAILRDTPALRDAIGIDAVPHFTTLQKTAARLLRFAAVRRLLSAMLIAPRHGRRRIERAAIDSSGFEAGRVSPYFVRRRARGQKHLKNPLFQTTTYTRWPKLGLIIDCATHLILAARPSRGPKPDTAELEPVLDQLPRGVRLLRLLADAGYDSEPNHVLLRERHRIMSLMPARLGRPSTKPPSGRYRRLMRRLWAHPKRIKYGQRWQVETVFSMIKRNLTHAVAAQTYWSQCRAMLLLAVTHNIMILLGLRRFSTEHS